MSRKYSQGDIVRLNAKKQVKRGEHYVDINGIRYPVSPLFDGLLQIIYYDVEKDAYRAKEVRGTGLTTMLIPVAILDMYSELVKSPRSEHKYNKSDVVLVTFGASRTTGSYKEKKLGDMWIDSHTSRVLIVRGVNTANKKYTVEDTNGYRHNVSWQDLEKSAELVPMQEDDTTDNTEHTPEPVVEEEPTKVEPAQIEQRAEDIAIDNAPIIGSDMFTDLVFVNPQSRNKDKQRKDIIGLYTTQNSRRLIVNDYIKNDVLSRKFTNIRVVKNDLTGEIYLVFCNEGGLKYNHSVFSRDGSYQQRPTGSVSCQTVSCN